MRKLRFGLAVKFGIIVFLLVLLLSFLTAIGYITESMKHIRTTMREQGESTIRALAYSCEYGLLIENVELLDEVIERFMKEPGIIYIIVKNAKGEELVSYGDVLEKQYDDEINEVEDLHGDELKPTVIEFESAFDFVYPVISIKKKQSREDIGLFSPVENLASSEQIGTVQMGLSKANMLTAIRETQKNAFLTITANIVVAILLAIILINFMVRPIKRLAIAAERVSQGDFDHPVYVKSRDEIGLLADSFNKMVEELKKSRQSLQYRLDIEKDLANMSKSFINLRQENISDGIKEAIETIGKAVDVDITYLFLLSENGKEVDKIYDWYSNYIKPEGVVYKLKDIPIDSVSWWTEKFMRSEVISFSKVDDLPAEAGQIKDILQKRGAKSFAIVPLIYDDSLIGTLGFSTVRFERNWTNEDITFLKMVGEIIVNALQRSKFERALAQERNLLRTIIDNIPDPIYVKDTQGIYIVANSSLAKSSGMESPEGLIGKTEFDIMDHEIAFVHQLGEDIIINSGIPIINQEESDLKSNDKESWVLATRVPLYHTNGKIRGLIGINRDVTELKQSQEKLKLQLEETEKMTYELQKKTVELSKSNKELDSFIYTVSHDLKSPLVSIQGFSSMLAGDYGDKLDDMGKMYVERMQKNSERMGELIDNLLELSRIGRIKGKEEMVDISKLVSEIAEDLGPQLEARGTKLILKDNMPKLYGDRTRISQVFSNLMSNANKFMGDNKEPIIEIGYSQDDGYHKFYVKDNGIGIDKEHHEKIFQIFQRLEEVKVEGTGIGLSIVKKIVNNMKGEIWLDSEKGKGATFYFTIPKAQVSENEGAKL